MTIPEIKTQLSIATVLAHYGLKPDSNNKLCCPFHVDDTPSLQVYPKTNTWHCFGCGKGADVLDFIGYKEECNVHNSALIATELTGVQVAQAESKPIIKREGLTLELVQLNDVFPKMKSNLRQSKDAQAYLLQRGLDVNILEIGYNGRTYKDLKHCITFALRDVQNNVSGMYGRSVFDNANAKHFYLKESTGLYPCYPKENTLKLIITESIIDAATLLQLPTITNNYSILACYGTNRLNDEIQQAIKVLPNLQEIIFAFDNDTAGNTAVAKYAEQLKNEQLIISTLVLPNKDINETYLSHNEEVFTHLLEERKVLHGNINKPLEALVLNPVVEPSQSEIEVQYENTLTQQGDKLIYTNEHVTATVWGGIDVYNIKRLRATLHLQSRANDYLEYRDTVDLYSHSVTQKLIREASERLETGTIAMQKTIVALTKALENYREQERENYAREKEALTNRSLETFTTIETEQAITFLQQPNLMQLTQQHIEKIGLVGEEEKGMLLFFILLTRMFKTPLHAVVQGKSGSGKTYLLKKIASLIPNAHICVTTAITENTLYHSPKGFWVHKILLIEDLDGAAGATCRYESL
jgi:DNA primase